MLVIKDHQIEALRRARIERFMQEMHAYIASEYPEHYARLGGTATLAFIERCIAAAKDLGIDTDGAVGAMIELWLVYGESLERSPDREWAWNILNHKVLPGYIKVEAVQNRFSETTDSRTLVVFEAAK